MTNWVAREKSPAHTTTRLLQLIADATASAQPAFSDLRRGFGRFPVVGYVWYQDDYGAPRYVPYFHPHEGTDLFAVSGTPVIAVVDGFIWKLGAGGTGGTSIWLMNSAGGYYYYGHLRALAPGLSVGDRVRVGQLVGFVGDSGDAKGTYPHVHFEMHPGGTPDSVNPKPYLDAWLRAAESRALGALGLAPDAFGPVGAARWGTLFDFFAQPGAEPPALWTAGLDAGGSTIAYADLALSDLLAGQDWVSLGPPATVGASGDLGSTFQPFDPVALLMQGASASDHND